MHSDSDETPSAPVMFCHDGTTIFYPTGPGRVHMIDIIALAECDGSDECFADSTKRGDVGAIIGVSWCGGAYDPLERTPGTWPRVYMRASAKNADLSSVDVLADVLYASSEARDQDFTDCLEMWADWCDRNAARLDSLDGPSPDDDAAGILARLRDLIRKSFELQVSDREIVEELIKAISDGQAVVAA